MTTFLSALILLGVIIFVHELGHFLFAKLVDVKVLKFSLGFGPSLFGVRRGETEYVISAIPLGGYVKMLGEDSEGEIAEEEKARAFNFQPVWKRALIVLSGPVFNLVFAAVVFVAIFMSGVPLPHPDVGKITEKSPAFRAGLMTGDRILEINGKPIQTWDEVDAAVDESLGRPLLLEIKRDGRTIDLSVTPEKKSEPDLFGEKKKVWDIGAAPLLYPIAGDVIKGARADKGGMKKGDRILEIEGKPLQTWQDMTAIIHDNPETPLRFKIKRNGRVLDLTIAPQKSTVRMPGGEEKTIGLIGIRPQGNDFIKRFGLPSALLLGASKTWEVSVLTVVSIIKLVERIIPAETIGGPILIFQMAGEQASHGALSFFTFMSVISINLGVLNFLPIPVLDGGHMLFLGIEAVRRKPLSEKVMTIAQRVGLTAIITLMVFAFYNDIMRLITGKMIP
jgi:regulator of sigma E protease